MIHIIQLKYQSPIFFYAQNIEGNVYGGWMILIFSIKGYQSPIFLYAEIMRNKGISNLYQ